MVILQCNYFKTFLKSPYHYEVHNNDMDFFLLKSFSYNMDVAMHKCDIMHILLCHVQLQTTFSVLLL